MTYICLGRKVSKVEKFRILQTCHSYNESAIVVSFQFLVLVDSRILVVLVYLPASKVWILRFRHCVVVDNLLKNLSLSTHNGAPPPQSHLFPSLKIIFKCKINKPRGIFPFVRGKPRYGALYSIQTLCCC